MKSLKIGNKGAGTNSPELIQARLKGQTLEYRADTDDSFKAFDPDSIKAADEQFRHYDAFTKNQVRR